jgi:hypothetical protein
MDTKGKGKGFLLAAAVLGSLVLGAGPALAQHSGGGGHAGGGGGGHFGGGAHAAVGGHVGGGAHFAGGAHYAAGGYRGYGGAGYEGGFHGSAYAGYRGGYGRAGGYYGHGYSTGAYWRGGYWHGGFWPRAYYGVGFSWFLPVLPLAYATYWYGGIPYYYANDVYYTYSPDYDGYVATDPPPAADPNGAGAGAAPNAPPPSSDQPDSAPPPDAGQGANPGPSQAPNYNYGGGAAGQIFMYPKNGQSAQQQATDKAECQQWATQQAGQVAQNGSDYQRAMAACVEGRGYSAR